ncbi:MAG: hypothetical protein GWQ05_10905 [Verrucomicrobiaceae bacterium]|nr:hypothetical protein [Verrucomicrobiaceae bacterium]
MKPGEKSRPIHRLLTTELACAAALLAICFQGVSCSSPGVQRLSRPITDSALLRALMDPTELAEETATTLREERLLKVYRRDPFEAQRTLAQRYEAQPTEPRRQALAEISSGHGDRLAETDQNEAIGHYLDAAALTHTAALEDATAVEATPDSALYDYAVSRVTMLAYESQIDLSQAFRTSGNLNSYVVRLAQGDHLVSPRQFNDMAPADFLEFKGIELKRVIQEGFGAALVGHIKHSPEWEQRDPFMSPSGFGIPVNGSLRFNGPDVTLVLQNLTQDHLANIGDKNVPLKGDYTAPLVFRYYEERDAEPNKIMAALRPSEYSSTIGMHSLEPFDPDKTPLILVHGLLSTAEGWLPFLNRLRQDPVVREHYQIVLFNYPTGTPIAENSVHLRSWLTKFSQTYDPKGRIPNMRNMVILGHSMGGLLSNMQIRDSGDALLKLVFKDPIDQVNIDPAVREKLADIGVFKANPDIDRAIFMAAPHRGSEMASNVVGHIGAWLIRLPFDLVDSVFGNLELIDQLTDVGQQMSKRPRNSVASLRTDNPILSTLLTLPVAEKIEIHSIIAQTKRDVPVPDGTDGVVRYWSSHLDEAVSEKIIYKENHRSMVEAEESLIEVWRILYQHMNFPWNRASVPTVGSRPLAEKAS